MTPRMWFSLVLRAFGAWTIIHAAQDAVGLLDVKLGIYTSMQYPASLYAFNGAMNLLIGAILLKVAPSIAGYFYPDSSE
ncbi:MAG: hypothetical protein P4L83_00590 [Nevskia sp.]|nr:hypothetical protein [Nevskia sp.]